MPRPRVPNYFTFKLVPSKYIEAPARDALSDSAAAIGQIHGCLGLLDWSVTLDDSEKVLAVESEFLDLSSRAGEAHPIELWFGERKEAEAARADFKRLHPQQKTTDIARERKRDWMKLWRRHYRPIQIVQNGEILWIVPSWQKFPSKAASHTVVRIHPGQAFGTGTHPTTELCLRACFEFGARIKGDPKLGLNVLDFGAGTGILGIAALKWAKKRKLKAKLVTCEIDPEARLILDKNRRLNHVTLTSRANLPTAGKYDIVFANVLAHVLVAHRKKLLARLAKGGILVLSGILREQGKQFLEDFLRGQAPRFTCVRSLHKEDWSAFVISRASPGGTGSITSRAHPKGTCSLRSRAR